MFFMKTYSFSWCKNLILQDFLKPNNIPSVAATFDKSFLLLTKAFSGGRKAFFLVYYFFILCFMCLYLFLLFIFIVTSCICISTCFQCSTRVALDCAFYTLCIVYILLPLQKKTQRITYVEVVWWHCAL